MKTAWKIAGSVVAMAALAGCVSGNPQVAAYVGPDPVAQTDVDTIAQALSEATSDTTDSAATYQQTVVSILVQSKLAAGIAASKGITVTDEQRQQVYASNELYAALVNNPVTTKFMTEYANTAFIVSDEVGKAELANVLQATTITLNPRLGTWDADNVAVADGSSGSLSELAGAQQ